MKKGPATGAAITLIASAPSQVLVYLVAALVPSIPHSMSPGFAGEFLRFCGSCFTVALVAAALFRGIRDRFAGWVFLGRAALCLLLTVLDAVQIGKVHRYSSFRTMSPDLLLAVSLLLWAVYWGLTAADIFRPLKKLRLPLCLSLSILAMAVDAAAVITAFSIRPWVIGGDLLMELELFTAVLTGVPGILTAVALSGGSAPAEKQPEPSRIGISHSVQSYAPDREGLIAALQEAVRPRMKQPNSTFIPTAEVWVRREGESWEACGNVYGRAGGDLLPSDFTATARRRSDRWEILSVTVGKKAYAAFRVRFTAAYAAAVLAVMVTALIIGLLS